MINSFENNLNPCSLTVSTLLILLNFKLVDAYHKDSYTYYEKIKDYFSNNNDKSWINDLLKDYQSNVNHKISDLTNQINVIKDVLKYFKDHPDLLVNDKLPAFNQLAYKTKDKLNSILENYDLKDSRIEDIYKMIIDNNYDNRDNKSLKSFLNDIQSDASNQYKYVYDEIEKEFKRLKSIDLKNKVQGKITNSAEDFQKSSKNMLNDLKDGLSSAIQTASDDYTSSTKYVWDTLNSFMDQSKDKMNDVKDSTYNKYEDISNYVSDSQSNFMDSVTNLKNKIDDTNDQIVEHLSESGTQIKEITGKGLNCLGLMGGDRSYGGISKPYYKMGIYSGYTIESNPIPVTALWSSLICIMYLFMGIRLWKLRLSTKIFLGDGLKEHHSIQKQLQNNGILGKPSSSSYKDLLNLDGEFKDAKNEYEEVNEIENENENGKHHRHPHSVKKQQSDKESSFSSSDRILYTKWNKVMTLVKCYNSINVFSQQAPLFILLLLSQELMGGYRPLLHCLSTFFLLGSALSDIGTMGGSGAGFGRPLGNMLVTIAMSIGIISTVTKTLSCKDCMI